MKNVFRRKGKEHCESSTQPKRKKGIRPNLRDESDNEGDEIQRELDRGEQMDVDLPDWKEKSKRLSAFPKAIRPALWYQKMSSLQHGTEGVLVYERAYNVEQLRLIGLTQKFERIGWEAALNFCENRGNKIYMKAIEQWMSTLERDFGDNPPHTLKLTGTVGKKKMTLSFETMRQIANFDSCPAHEYYYIPEEYFWAKTQLDTDPSNMFDNVIPRKRGTQYCREDMACEARFILGISFENLMARLGDRSKVRGWDVRVVHAIMFGTPRLSFRHLVMTNIWDSRESQERKMIPHVRLLSYLMEAQGVVTRSTPAIEVKVVKMNWGDFYKAKFTYERTAEYHILLDKQGNTQMMALREGVEHANDEEVHTDEEEELQEEAQVVRERPVREMTRQELEMVAAINRARPAEYRGWTSFKKCIWDRGTRTMELARQREAAAMAREERRGAGTKKS